MAKPIKVRVMMTIELDPDDWTLAHGVEGIAAIRNDVRGHVHYVTQAIFSEVSEFPGTVRLNE